MSWTEDITRLKAANPRHILFLCVANSARSQIAEGIARSIAPEGIRISSAGSIPTKIRPEAVAVLKEIGIDASRQYSKGMSEIDAESVDTVITLCSEEVCPFFPGQVMRLHWGLEDPAAVTGSEEERMSAFREVRDELAKRLKKVFE
jgi:arsenate reductase